MCGRAARTEEEVRNWFGYGCCRAEVRIPELSPQVRCCRWNPDKGEYTPPDEEPEMYQDPQAFKENFMKKYQERPKKDLKKKKDERK